MGGEVAVHTVRPVSHPEIEGHKGSARLGPLDLELIGVGGLIPRYGDGIVGGRQSDAGDPGGIGLRSIRPGHPRTKFQITHVAAQPRV